MLRGVIRKTGAVALGTAAGQALVLASTPLLARLYSPEAFGQLALLLTVSNVSTAAACFRYDLALPSSADRDRRALLITCVACAAISGVLAAVALVLAVGTGWIEPPSSALPRDTLLVASCVFLVGLFQATLAYQLRQSQITTVAWMRFSQGLVFSAFGALPVCGLLWAHIASFGAGLIGLGALRRRNPADGVTSWQAAKSYRGFPFLSLPGAMLDVLGYSICVWTLSQTYGASETGHYSQLQRLIGAPLMLVSISLAQILLKQTAELAHQRAALTALLGKLLLGLGGLSAAAGALLWVAGEPLLEWILGDRWHIDRSMIMLVAAAVFVRACVSPLSSVLITFRRFGWALAWQSAYFTSALLLFPYVASRVTFPGFLGFYAAHEAIFYGAYLVIIARVVRVEPPAQHPAITTLP